MKKFFIKIGIVLFLYSTAPQYTTAQPFNANLAAKLQQTLDVQVAAFPDTKGVSASVYYPGQGIWKGTSGISYAGHPITSDMEFGIASNTKLFTAVAVMKLVENNILNLNDQLQKWLPKYKNVDSSITIRQLLNHTSGIADVFTAASIAFIEANPAHNFTTAEVMAYIGPKLFSKGTSYGYSNTNYILAGMIIESAIGQPVSKIIRDSILTPLQLDSTFYDGKETVLGTIAHPWQDGVDVSAKSRNALNTLGTSAGSMYSTASEMAQWYQALLSGQVVSANSLKEITTFVSSGSYGFGILTMQLFGRTLWGHGGSNTGYKSRMFYDPIMKTTVCGLSNSNPSAIDGGITGVLLKTIVDYLPEPAGSIIGTTVVCQGQNSITYSVSPITNAVSYTWTLPNGSTAISTTNSITINYDKSATSGNISVVGTNSYGDGLLATLPIIVHPLPNVSFLPQIPRMVCNYSPPIILAGGSPLGGVYSGIGVKNGMFDPALSGVGEFVVTYSYTTTNGCVNSDSTVISVVPKPTVTFNIGTENKQCIESAPIKLTGGLPIGGTYSGIGVQNGIFNPKVSGVGKYVIRYFYADSNGCSSTDSVLLTVVPMPIVTYNLSQHHCLNSPPITLSGGTPKGGIYSGIGTKDGVFDPSISGAGDFTVFYSYTDGNGCVNSDSSVITVDKPSFSTFTETSANSYSLNGKTYTQSGIYTQLLKNSVGCDSILTLNLTITTTTVDEDETPSIFTMYPNPSNGTFILEIENKHQSLAGEEIDIYNLFGTKIFSTILSNQKIEIALNVESGIYVFHVKAQNKINSTGKVIIR
jgi:CubicO group peptidase (beta-lactamase class C family)